MTQAENLLLSGRADDPWPDDIRPRRRARFIAPIGFLLVLAVIGTYLGLVLTAPLPAATVSVHRPSVTVPAAPALVTPLHGTTVTRLVPQAPILGSGEITAASGPASSTSQLPIASITKLITALVILDAEPIAPGELGPTITFTEADSDLYDDYYVRLATVQPMKTGASMTLHDALEMMLVASASNYAEAVSTKVYGSPARFLGATRAWLAKNGLFSTNIFEPTGLDPRNVSTVDDLMQLADLALANPVVAEIVAMPRTMIQGYDSASNTNDLVGELGIDGLKTGTLDEAGSCLIYSATVTTDVGVPVRVTGVILGGENRYSVDNDVRAVLASVQTYAQTVPLIAKGDRVASYTTPWGASADAVAAASAATIVWNSITVGSDVSTNQVVTARNGADVGTIVFGLADTERTEVLLELDRAIEEPDAWWRITHPTELLGR